MSSSNHVPAPEQTSEKTSAGETPSWLADGAAAWAAPGSPGTAESPVPVVPVERPVPDESPEQLLGAGSGAGLQPG
ncbi:hypothetical protein, partial [Pseudonocardia sp. Ae406_Ps2]|uniref:hypothetical protein n=1 Tax=Pseudonocardia sp. Ae406_Ps2 TaxID=1885033 RepID=UPI001BAFAFB3